MARIEHLAARLIVLFVSVDDMEEEEEEASFDVKLRYWYEEEPVKLQVDPRFLASGHKVMLVETNRKVDLMLTKNKESREPIAMIMSMTAEAKREEACPNHSELVPRVLGKWPFYVHDNDGVRFMDSLEGLCFVFDWDSARRGALCDCLLMLCLRSEGAEYGRHHGKTLFLRVVAENKRF